MVLPSDEQGYTAVGTAPTIQDVCTAAHREATISTRSYI